MYIPFVGEVTGTGSFTAAYENEKRTRSGVYPIGINGLWHTGIHLSYDNASDKKNKFIKQMITGGDIVAYKIADDYEYRQLTDIDEINKYVDGVDLYKILNNAKENYPELYEKITGNRNEEPENIHIRIIKRDSSLLDNNAKEALSKILTAYSTSYVLTKHTFTVNEIKTQGETAKKIEYFILYSNLAPLCDYNVDNELCRCFFRKWTVKKDKYKELSKKINKSEDNQEEEMSDGFLLFDNKEKIESKYEKYKKIFLEEIKEIEILDTEIYKDSIYNVRIGDDFGYIKLARPLSTDDVQAGKADNNNITGYIGMQGYSQNHAVHIEVFMPSLDGFKTDANANKNDHDDLFYEKCCIRNRISSPNIKIYGNMEEVNVPFYDVENTDRRKTVIRVYGWNDKDMYKCKRDDLVAWQFRTIPKKTAYVFTNEIFEFEINGRVYTLKNKKFLHSINNELQYEVLLDANERIEIDGSKYLVGQETYIISCERFDWNSHPNGVSTKLWAHQGNEGREWYAFKDDIDECCYSPFDGIKREKSNNKENEETTYTYRVYKTRPRCVYASSFSANRLTKCQNPLEEDFIFRRSEGINIDNGKYIRFKSGSSYYFIKQDDITRVFLNNNINNNGSAGILQYNVFSLPFFTSAEVNGDSLICKIDDLNKHLSREVSSDDMYPGFIYNQANSDIYERFNELIVNCVSMWERKKNIDKKENIDIAKYGYSIKKGTDKEDVYKEYIWNQLWMDDDIKKKINDKSNIFYYFHPINFLKHVCMELRAINIERLKRVQDMVLAIERLKKGAQGLYPEIWKNEKDKKAPPGQTYCNHAAFLTVIATDGKFYNFTNKQKSNPDSVIYPFPEIPENEVTQFKEKHDINKSNYWCDELERLANQGRLVKLTSFEAHWYGNMGYTVVASYKANAEDGEWSPHFATVRPGEDYHDTLGPMVVNVGEHNIIERAGDGRCFHSKFNYTKWYYNPRQDFRGDTRWIEQL